MKTDVTLTAPARRAGNLHPPGARLTTDPHDAARLVERGRAIPPDPDATHRAVFDAGRPDLDPADLPGENDA